MTQPQASHQTGGHAWPCVLIPQPLPSGRLLGHRPWGSKGGQGGKVGAGLGVTQGVFQDRKRRRKLLVSSRDTGQPRPAGSLSAVMKARLPRRLGTEDSAEGRRRGSQRPPSPREPPPRPPGRQCKRFCFLIGRLHGASVSGQQRCRFGFPPGGATRGIKSQHPLRVPGSAPGAPGARDCGHTALPSALPCPPPSPPASHSPQVQFCGQEAAQAAAAARGHRSAARVPG